MFAKSVVARAAGLVAGAAFAFTLLTSPVLADAKFERWVASFRTTAQKNGISKSTLDRAFRGVTAPDPEVLEKARYQPEFPAPVWD